MTDVFIPTRQCTGTGKTFVGATLSDIILRHSNETILVLCYTNHALDQFLEYLLKRGSTASIVRIGSRSQNPALENYNLRSLTRKVNATGVDRRRVAVLHGEIENAQKNITKLEKAAGESPCWWRGFQQFVEEIFPEVSNSRERTRWTRSPFII